MKENKHVYIKKSRIHGKGLFARKRIKAGQLIGVISGKPTRKNGPYVLWIDNKNAVEVTCHLRFINHSDSPNAVYYDTLEVAALRDIEKDEEITHDYGW